MAARDLPPFEGLSRDDIAASLIGRRDRLLRQLPRQIKLARCLTADQHELVIDEAIDYLVTRNRGIVADEDALERAFWKVADLRVRRAHEGRHNTVRAGWQRVDVDEIDVADDEASPEDVAMQEFERATLEEFAAELSLEEQAVLAVKYSGPKELGRFEIARLLGRKPYEIRRSERAIVRKLKAFSAILAAGKLCDERHEALEALAFGRATPLDHQRAHVHLAHCPPCRTEYTGLIRAIKSGQLPREIGQILPLPAIDAVERHRGPWEVIVDWCSRPFGHDVTITVTQLAPAGRALSVLAGAKIVTTASGEPPRSAAGCSASLRSRAIRRPLPRRSLVRSRKSGRGRSSSNPRRRSSPRRQPRPARPSGSAPLRSSARRGAKFLAIRLVMRRRPRFRRLRPRPEANR